MPTVGRLAPYGRLWLSVCGCLVVDVIQLNPLAYVSYHPVYMRIAVIRRLRQQTAVRALNISALSVAAVCQRLAVLPCS